MRDDDVWFRLGQAAGELAGRSRVEGSPFASRKESWHAASDNARAAGRRWLAFADGWVDGFATAYLQPGTSPVNRSRTPSASRCGVELEDGQLCQLFASILLPGGVAARCPMHAHQFFQALDQGLNKEGLLLFPNQLNRRASTS
jgi:hypothetical protein